MKKILFCIHRNSPFYKPIPKTLRELGYKVFIFDYYQPSFNIRALGFLNSLAGLDHSRAAINNLINQELLSTVSKIKPDYLLVIKGLDITNKTINKISRTKIITINWFQDLLEFMPWLKIHAQYYDFIFNPDPLMVRELKKNKITSYYLPLATLSDKNISAKRKRYDIVFSGQHTLRREKLFSKLAQLGSKFIIWGYPGWKQSSLANHYMGLLPSIESVIEKFRQSKIVVNVQTGEDKFPSEVISLRAFEATGAGALLLNWRHKHIDNFWENNKEIVNFTTKDDLLKKAKYYLINNTQREKIALAGWQRSAKDHTYVNRLTKMFEIIKTKK